jgi:hypothetical protein
MSIPALGGGSNPALQRALMDAAERALADEAALLGEDEAAGSTSTTGAGASATAARAVRRRSAGAASEGAARLLGEAIVVELGEAGHAERLEVAGGWITTAKRGPLETRDMPNPTAQTPTPAASPPTRGVPTPAGGAPATAQGAPTPAGSVPIGSLPTPAPPGAPAPSARPTPAAGQPAAQRSEQPIEPAGQPGETITLDRLLVVLKKTGIDFRDAYQVLKEIHAGEPLPPRAELQARWAAADPAAWEERAHVQQSAGQQSAHPQSAQEAMRAQADADLRQTPIDHLIRDRAWHRASGEGGPEGTTGDSQAPTLQTITRLDAANQAYVAGLSTAEFQRLVTILGVNAPAWFWDLRGHRGLRGLAERPAIARLNATRIAGTRLGAWILACLGMAVLWYAGIHTDVWW